MPSVFTVKLINPVSVSLTNHSHMILWYAALWKKNTEFASLKYSQVYEIMETAPYGKRKRGEIGELQAKFLNPTSWSELYRLGNTEAEKSICYNLKGLT